MPDAAPRAAYEVVVLSKDAAHPLGYTTYVDARNGTVLLRENLVNFADDAYDVGGRMADARAAFAKSGVDAVVIDNPEGFKGHGAASDIAFARKFGGCIESFIDQGTKQPPC